MRLLCLGVSVALASAAQAEPKAPRVPPQTLVFWNARLALREGRPTDALKLWMLHNGLRQAGQPAAEEGDFSSVVWAALGELGLCQQTFPRDQDQGAGLWPLALHNYVVRAAFAPEPPPRAPPFAAFQMARQARTFSLHDVLDAEELRSVRFHPTACTLPGLPGGFMGRDRGRMGDRIEMMRYLRHTLSTALETVTPGKTRGMEAVEARLFDLDLALIDAETRRLRLAGVEARTRARELGLSPEAVLRARVADTAWPPTSAEGRFLRRTLTWRADAWLTLERERRVFLFSLARAYAPDDAAAERVALAVIDALVVRGLGAEVQQWVGATGTSPRFRDALTQGERGLRLLTLDNASGFRERSAVALHRAVAFLEAGQLKDALRAFAYALAEAETSREAAALSALCRRWLAYVLAQFQADAEVIRILETVLPKPDYRIVAADLVWRAALRRDAASFEALMATLPRGSAFDTDAADLRKLAHGRIPEMLSALAQRSQAEPHLTLRLCARLLDNLEAEATDVRRSHLPTLRGLLSLFDEIAARTTSAGAQKRRAEELGARSRALLEGLRAPLADDAAHALSPRAETFAGNIRVAPSDPLPWPFPAPDPKPTSVFVPLRLQPLEWRDETGALIFGWSVSD
ncbi:MAG: hypothetical protein KA712_23840 [Myxococcales bacterium]|nr:hypothetical protein [Myxococcales bacterium]